MLARYAFLSIVAIGALASAASMAPGDLERLAMLERDGRHEQAMSELQQLYNAGERNPRLLLRLYDLKIRFGAVDDARDILEEYARARPSDTEAQIGLIRFYQTNQLEAPYVTALKALQERTRSRELLSELLSFYRMTGRFREEEDLLERTSRANRAAPADFERLGLLAAARGDLQRAARALRRADGRLDEQSRPARVGLFRVLVELKELDEAHQRCLVWLRSWRDSETAVEFMDALSSAGRYDLALDIGNRFGGQGRDTTLVSAELLHEQAKNGEALLKLREYGAGGMTEDPDRVQRFVAVASATNGAELALRAARTLGLRKMESGIVIDLLDAVRDALDPDQPALSPELVKGFAGEIESRLQNVTPIGQEATDQLTLPDDLRLFTAHLAILDKDRDLARRLLASVDPDHLSSTNLATWTDLQVASGLRATAFPNLPNTWQRRDRTDRAARRLSRADRTVTTAAPTARAQTPAPAPASQQAYQSLPQPDQLAVRERRNRRRLQAIERRRERARLSAQRREQLNAPVQYPKAQSTPPLPPTPFPATSSGG